MESNKFWFLMSPYMSLDGKQSSPFTAFSIEFCIPNCLNVGCGKSGLESQMLILNFNFQHLNRGHAFMIQIFEIQILLSWLMINPTFVGH